MTALFRFPLVVEQVPDAIGCPGVSPAAQIHRLLERLHGVFVAAQLRLHHAHLNEHDDADRLFGSPDDSTRRIAVMCLMDLAMVTAVKRLLQYMHADRRSSKRRRWPKLTPRLVTCKYTSLIRRLNASSSARWN